MLVSVQLLTGCCPYRRVPLEALLVLTSGVYLDLEGRSTLTDAWSYGLSDQQFNHSLFQLVRLAGLVDAAVSNVNTAAFLREAAQPVQLLLLPRICQDLAPRSSPHIGLVRVPCDFTSCPAHDDRGNSSSDNKGRSSPHPPSSRIRTVRGIRNAEIKPATWSGYRLGVLAPPTMSGASATIENGRKPLPSPSACVLPNAGFNRARL